MPAYDGLPRAFGLGAVGYYMDFVLAPPVAALMIWVAIGGLGVMAVVGLAVAGFIAWTLAEYLIHRFMFHGFPMLRRMHDVHHAHPKDYIGVASYGVALVAVVVWLLLAMMMSVAASCGAVAGVVLGYLFYIVIHDRFHHGARSRFGRYVRFMERYHAGHHRGGETNFGVTSPVWDVVFRTYRPIR